MAYNTNCINRLKGNIQIMDIIGKWTININKDKIYKAYVAAIVFAQKSLFGKKILLTYLNKN